MGGCCSKIRKYLHHDVHLNKQKDDPLFEYSELDEDMDCPTANVVSNNGCRRYTLTFYPSYPAPPPDTVEWDVWALQFTSQHMSRLMRQRYFNNSAPWTEPPSQSPSST